MYRKTIAILLILSMLVIPSVLGEDTLSEEQLRELLYELNEQQGGASFLVLPEGFRMPSVGADGEFRLLIIGVDTDKSGLSGRSDTMILAVFSAREKTLKLISFMRDLYVKLPGRGHNRLNAAYAFGRTPLLLQSLQDSFGVAADAYVAVDFSLMIELIDAVGGIRMDVSETEVKPLNGILSYYNYLNGEPEQEGILRQHGSQILSGLQAMSYARIRKSDSDFQRVGRQQKVLEAIYHRLMLLPPQDLADVLLGQVSRVGTDITTVKAIGLLQDLLGAGVLEISTLSVPVQGAYASKMINKTFYLVPNLAKNRAAIAEFLHADP